MEIKECFTKPLFFENNRVFRVYKGGKGFEGFLPNAEDGIFPEEWVASSVKAINPRYFGRRDGVSVIRGTDVFFDDLLSQHPHELLGNRTFDCLVKFLDSAIRLPVQVHPNKTFSRKHFKSSYGKTEAWLVIATRENPKLYFGFNREIDKATLSELEERSETEKDVMTSVLNCVTPQVGDVYLITSGLIHAIGEGCTIVEIQEPTDFTIQPERWCGDYHISYEEEFIGLDKDVALDCFNYNLYGDKALRIAKKTPKILHESEKLLTEALISYDDTPCFALLRHTLKGGSLLLADAPAVIIVLDGNASLADGTELHKGDYFFLPYAARGTVVYGENAVLLECQPSEQN